MSCRSRAPVACVITGLSADGSGCGRIRFGIYDAAESDAIEAGAAPLALTEWARRPLSVVTMDSNVYRPYVSVFASSFVRATLIEWQPTAPEWFALSSA